MGRRELKDHKLLPLQDEKKALETEVISLKRQVEALKMGQQEREIRHERELNAVSSEKELSLHTVFEQRYQEVSIGFRAIILLFSLV